MQSAVRIGRYGPITFYLNYTWLLAFVLGLWWLALLWLPENYPRWNGAFYWLVAILVMLLFVVSMIGHELVHTAVARTGPRSANLFPFGAAVPLQMRLLDSGRAFLAALAGLLFNLVLGGILLVLASTLQETTGVTGAIKGVLTPLGMLNLGIALINLLPGIPFDMGWALRAGIGWFGSDRDSGLRLAQTLGGVVSLVLMLAGAWRGLTSDAWIEALTLLLLGWAAREAGEIGQQRTLLRGAFDQLKARDFMERTRPGDAVPLTDTVADMVRSHPRYAPELPLPVVDESGTLKGVATLAAADNLLQGAWPSTPVRAIMSQPSEVKALQADSTLNDILALAQARQGTPEEEMPIPVLDDGKLVGSVDPGRLLAFREMGRQVGAEETVPVVERVGVARQIGSVLPAMLVIAAMAIFGGIALRTDPVDLRERVADGTSATVRFSNFAPGEGAIIGTGPGAINVQMAGARPITTATLTLDGQPLAAELSGTDSLTRTLSAQMPGLTQGMHTVAVTATTESGRSKRTEWQFRVSAGGDAGGEEPTPAPIPATGLMRSVRYMPGLGGKVLAGEVGAIVGAILDSPQPPEDARILLDGQELEATINQVSGADDRYSIEATTPPLGAGSHRVRLELGGAYTSEWTFSAQEPDENNAYFKETGQFVSQPFLSYWLENGGLAIFGYPVSDRVQERTQGTNQAYTAQYFERARFELHQDTGEQVILGRLGALQAEVEPPAQPIEGAQFFPETGHNVSEAFLRFWNENGGLAVFGYPITEERVEKNPVDGKEYTVQYFERNRFELHPEHAGTPFEVQLGQLGASLYNERYNP